MDSNNRARTSLIKKSKKQVVHSETDILLPHQNSSKEKKSQKVLRKLGEKLGGTALQVVTNLSNRKSLKPEGSEPTAEESFEKVLENKQYYEACCYILKQEKSSEDVNRLYITLGNHMWRTVTTALSGDCGHIPHLQSVAASLRWATEEASNHGSEWIPGTWEITLEKMFTKHIIENLPQFVYNPRDEKCLERYLEELEGKILQKVTGNECLLGDLYNNFLRRLPDCMLLHLTSLASTHFSYEERVLLYRWAYKESRSYRELLFNSALIPEDWKMMLCLETRQLSYQLKTETCDHLLFNQWFVDNKNKIKSAGQETVRKDLGEILQREYVWNENRDTELQCCFNDIPKEIDKVMKVAEGLSDVIISIIQAVCRDELSHFISRYNNFVQNKVRETDSITGFYVTLRIIRNCHIVRSTYKDLVKTLEGTRAAMELIDQTESHALDLLVAALRSTIKEAFINYFTRDSSEYEKVLYALQESIKYAEIQNSEMVMKRTHCSVVVFYIQAFLKHSKKGSDSKTLAQGSKKLQEMFTLLVPAEVKLDNPIKFISQILDSQDSGTESLEVTTFAFVDEHPDLREKHLNAILDIKGNMSWTQREKLVWIVKERKGYSEEGKMRYFDEVEVEFRAGRCCPCCVVS